MHTIVQISHSGSTVPIEIKRFCGTTHLTQALSARDKQVLENTDRKVHLRVIFLEVTTWDEARRIAEALATMPADSLWSQLQFPKLRVGQLKKLMGIMRRQHDLKLRLHPPP